MVAGESSGLLNTAPKATKSKESAPEVLSYRQRLYDRETLMLANEPWNPAQRLAQVCVPTSAANRSRSRAKL